MPLVVLVAAEAARSVVVHYMSKGPMKQFRFQNPYQGNVSLHRGSILYET